MIIHSNQTDILVLQWSVYYCNYDFLFLVFFFHWSESSIQQHVSIGNDLQSVRKEFISWFNQRIFFFFCPVMRKEHLRCMVHPNSTESFPRKGTLSTKSFCEPKIFHYTLEYIFVGDLQHSIIINSVCTKFYEQRSFMWTNSIRIILFHVTLRYRALYKRKVLIKQHFHDFRSGVRKAALR